MTNMSQPGMKRTGTFGFVVPAVVILLIAGGIALSKAKCSEPEIYEPDGKVQEELLKKRWEEVGRLVSEQKFEAALKEVEKIRTAAENVRDNDEWARSLVKEVQLRIGIHGYETAVRFLKERPWPEGLFNRSALNLFYARSLIIYYQAYSWEINQREKVESKGPVDLKAWTKDRIYAEAWEAFSEVWTERAELGGDPVARFSEYLDANTFPAGIRDTMRDAVSYLFVELLADTTFWKPEDSADLYRLDLRNLLAWGKSVQRQESVLRDEAIHPLIKMGYVLYDLGTWHAGQDRPEASLEARLEWFRRLQAAYSSAADKDLVLGELRNRLTAYKKYPWWSMGKAVEAEFVMSRDEAGKLIEAREIADQGWKAFPESAGGRRCHHVLKSIEAPGFQINSMLTDGFGKRSIEIAHKNIATLYFRAYPVDLEERIGSAKDYNLFPENKEFGDILGSGTPAAEWSVELPPTPDYETHRTFAVPALKTPGYYIIAASAKVDFSESNGNRIGFLHFVLTDLVLLSERRDSGSLDVRVLAGETGKPVAGAQVILYRYDWQSGHRKVEERLSDKGGVARFSYSGGRSNFSHFIIAKKGPQIAIDTDHIRFYPSSEPRDVRASLVYTDRSIYRPLQKVFWKVLVYGGSRKEGRFRTQPSQALTVSLLDPNGETVGSSLVKTNDFGTVAGEFVIPAGRLLGRWRVGSSLSGSSSIRVEEYKRPTFEVSFRDPEKPLRLNRPATLVGEAKYYFGLPVVNGTVHWHVTREPVYPWWWGWYESWRPRRSGTIAVAAGTAALEPDGTFTIEFTPEADERLAAETRDVSYSYRVTADLTDEGGETRTAMKAFRLGFVSVEARINMTGGFVRERTAGKAQVHRSDLNGVGRKGRGTWRIVILEQPGRAILPADEPLNSGAPGAASDSFRTSGDGQRARWNPDYNYARVLRGWADGPEIGHGTVEHDDSGHAEVTLPNLPAGAYRLHYETVDDFGAKFRTSKEFLAAGRTTPLALPALLLAESSAARVGETARLFAHSGLPGQTLFFEIWRDGELLERREIQGGKSPGLIEIPIRESDRGGFTARLTALADYQLMNFDVSVFVPWDNKELSVEFASFRDMLTPGGKETWRVTVKGPGDQAVEKGTAEVLAYMYDKSLDIFGPHSPPYASGLYPYRTRSASLATNLSQSPSRILHDSLVSLPGYPRFRGDRLKFYDSYGIGGPGRRFSRGVVGGVLGGVRREEALPSAAALSESAGDERGRALAVEGQFMDKDSTQTEMPAEAGEESTPLRSDFSETAFWEPHLLTDEAGSAAIEFTVPDSVTAWNVWVHAVTRDLSGGSLHREARSVKELMVRPYLPRFLREGDRAGVKVVVNNASGRALDGTVTLGIFDPLTDESLAGEFGLANADLTKTFSAGPGGGANVTFPLDVPPRPGLLAFKVTASADGLSDGELRPLPLLPGRMHLVQSRFVTLKDKDRRTMTFEDLQASTDPTLVNEQMVVTLDAQLFYSTLSALPYLVRYPYECTEQTLNRFVSTGILTSLYRDYPQVARMAEEFAKRKTRLETWDATDPNRKLALEETPWLVEARGGAESESELANVLDPRIATAERDAALAKLKKAQTSLGAFPWWPGGPPSPYMTLYIMYGLAKAAEFGVDVPRDVVERGWTYLARHYREEYAHRMLKDDCCWEFLTFLNYTVSCYPDPSWVGDALTREERELILNHCFRHWKRHSPYLKGMLALTLHRMGRPDDAFLVFGSVMDSARTTRDEGTFWAPEDRSWLWYNDTIETHAFALRTLMELSPEDGRKDGLVQWLFLNKKLNHWKSTRATAEVIYSLVHYLRQEKALAVREEVSVHAGGQIVRYVFDPDRYTGRKNQLVIPGDKVDWSTARVTVDKASPGFVFASASWHFSTERLPEEDRGDFFAVSRKFFRRLNTGREFVLRPLAEGEKLEIGDEVEIHLSIRSKHAAEYVHLRDPRAAGLEPENAVSRYKWDLGISWYEETRDSGTNFFFEWLPAGEYTFRYRLRANMAGVFRVGPATLQSMYAPEFNAYSAGAVVEVISK